MRAIRFIKFALAIAAIMSLAAFTAQSSYAQGQGQSKKEEKQLNKEARKLGNTAEEAERELGRKAVFCVLAAHTSVEGYDTAEQLKAKYESLTDFPFGQFVAAVLLADRLEKPLDEILDKLAEGSSIGRITKDYDVNMGEMRREFNEFRKELGRSMTNPPTRDCFSAIP